MKRLHVHVSVDRIDRFVRFYSTLFATAPTVVKPDYAKWMLDDPRMNFAISTRGGKRGVDHLGIEVETADELDEVYRRLRQAGGPVLDEGTTTCCYARSEKSWITDPQDLSWEAFLTSGESTPDGYGSDLGPIRTATPGTDSGYAQDACCASRAVPLAASCCAGQEPRV